MGDHLPTKMLTALEREMRASASILREKPADDLEELISYHIGWNARSSAAGKRIRPLLVLLSCAAAGGDWETALPAASAIEWLHNFSLIHDDIEDSSQTRRGRQTLWSQVGVPLAINAGDAIFALARSSIYRTRQLGISPEIVLEVNRQFDQTSLHLTQGQHLDMRFETRTKVTIDEYLQMIEGKTAALIECSCRIGALLAGTTEKRIGNFAGFGQNLGLSFQILDDQLGIWGTQEVTGKPRGDDLISHKKSLPILLGLKASPEFVSLWNQDEVATDLESMIACLDEQNIRAQTQAYADKFTQEALSSLELAQPTQEAGDILRELALSLLQRSA